MATPGMGPHRFRHENAFARARFENYQPFNRAVITPDEHRRADNAREGRRVRAL